MTILVTGSAGFIGSALTLRLLERGDSVIGIDNHNDYYDPSLKEARLARHKDHHNYQHFRINIEDGDAVANLFKDHEFNGVVNLAAQAGVRSRSHLDQRLCQRRAVLHPVRAHSSGGWLRGRRSDGLLRSTDETGRRP